MANTKKADKKVTKKPEPQLGWQTGGYERRAEYKFTLPYQFLLLCRLMDVTPRDVIIDFMDSLSCASWNREGKDKAKEQLINYFITIGYGQHHYTEEDIRMMFKEMDALGLVFPANGKTKVVDLYVKWRDKYHNYWFKKWFKKPKRKLSKEVTL